MQLQKKLQILHLENNPLDAELIRETLKAQGIPANIASIKSETEFRVALGNGKVDLILSDYLLPQFNALGALALLREMVVDLPFIIISGTIGESVAVEAMRAGAHDYLKRNNLVRLGQTIDRELHHAETRRARREAEAQLRLQSVALESAANSIMITGENGIIIWVNQAFTQNTGYSLKEALGKNPRLLKSGKQSDAFYEEMWETILSGKVWHNTVINQRKDGTLNHADLTITPIQNTAGRITNFVGIQQDITERTNAEEALRSSELRYRRLFESSHDGILILDADSGEIVDVNPYLIEMLGYSKEELAGKELWEIGPFKDIVASKLAFDELQQRGYIRYENLPLESREGHVRHAEVVSNSYLTGESRVIQCNIRDITERKLAEEDLRRTNQRLEEALAELLTKTQELASMTQQLWQASKLATMGELAASVAHELNNPLATISLYAEILVGQTAPGDPNLRPLLVIEQEVERMATLVSNLLLFSRRSHRQVSTLDICAELRSSLDFIQYHLRSHKIDIVEKCAAVLPTVQADREQLRQVFLNLITNAGDAMPEGGTLTVRSRAETMDGGQTAVVVEFSDTGIGIQPGDLPRLWEPFFTTKPEGKGTGLGLAICRRTVEEHRGTIEIETAPGRGTTVRITLPATEEGIEEAA